MSSTTGAGTSFAASVDLPATNTKAGFEALTFTEVEDVEKLGAIGATTQKTEFTPLKGGKKKFKGSTDYGSLSPTMAHNKEDAGQSILRTLGDPDYIDAASFRIIYPNGDKRYFTGRVFGYPESVDGADSVITANPTIEADTKIVKDDAPVIP
ncbi:MAG TPA: hypothetical protein VF503_20615 [Sphingobium sp.]|uniref:hypothetical protein n=1 Tax=Sphingobium sp. TaxID=1912891 RepID=UPI002ED11191